MDKLVADFAEMMWGAHLLVLLLGGGFFFLVYSRFAPIMKMRHAVQVLRGHYDDPNDPGKINHFEALSSALAQTIGMGNISGVAIAIMTGGPGALFWMWTSAFLGMATKFFTCTLSVMYRKKHPNGDVSGGPMYIITEGLSARWKPLAYLFALAGLIATLPMFEANQLAEAIREMVLEPNGWVLENENTLNLILGACTAGIVSLVIFGGLQRIAAVASKLVPFMVVAYTLSILTIIALNIHAVPDSLALIFRDAFTGSSVLGGALGTIIITGAKRAAFSNEAGIGTAPMFHGDARTNERVQEGLVAMLGTFIDTIIVCSMTALAIIVTGVWKESGMNGVSLTAKAFETSFGEAGTYLLVFAATVFVLTTLFTFSYYGIKCWIFLFGEKYAFLYNYVYMIAILLGSAFSIDMIINLIDGFYATMAIPTMTSALLLAPKVKREMKRYFDRLNNGELKSFK
ncbi:MAG: alanine:cation symporter family protein [Cytophagales bacterium]|nr:alanine:cation symporter family protein [Cytophagales bacterium]